jgi:alkylation response protein AidB-like acyl-CoA dehydrogenase
MSIEAATELAQEFRKHAAKFDETAELPVENLRALHDAGLDLAWLPEERGGQGRSWQEFGTVLTIIARACPSTATVWLMHLGAAHGLIDMSEEPRAAFFAAELAAGKRFANALSEPTGGNLFLVPLQVAEPDPDGHRLDGAKRFVSGCEIADYLFVNALVDGVPTFFGVEPDESITFVPIWDSMGMRATRSQLITFNRTLLRADRRCTRPPGAPNPIPLGLPFLSIGVAEAAFEALRSHALQRIIPTSGEPVAAMQWVQFGAAEAHVRLRAARLLAQEVMRLADEGSEEVLAVDFEAKYLANEVAKEVAALAVKIGGGSGYLRASDIQRHFRDAQAGALMAYSSEVCQSEIGKRLMTT